MIHSCPRCGNASVSWDARCGAFFCLAHGCQATFPPPREKTANGMTIRGMISRGQLVMLPRFFVGDEEGK